MAPSVPCCIAVSVSVSLLAFSGCQDEENVTPTPSRVEFGGDRPAYLEVPLEYDHTTPTPLVFLLHGYGAGSFVQGRYTGLIDLVDEQGVLYIAPDGLSDPLGKQYWNATDDCCDLYGSGVDDVGYLGQMLDDIKSVWNVDPQRVYFFGHSNGGYMSYRMACERADEIAAIVSLAGATYLDPADCAPSQPVSVLQIHGVLDETIAYVGDNGQPGGPRSVEIWADYDGCDSDRETDDAKLDLDVSVEGNETTVERSTGCPSSIDTELWTIEGGSHVPSLHDDFRNHVWNWLKSHPKP